MNPGIQRIGWTAATLYLATVAGANWLVEQFCTVSVGSDSMHLPRSTSSAPLS